jgi:NAD(P)-dependent dehydrogenase (short-subunit alcohol dehydrogenase family)
MNRELSIEEKIALKKWGLDDDELASRPTVYRDDLLDGQVFLISGGGTGMGRTLAYLATRLGAQVMICGRRQEMLDETAEGISHRLGKDVGTYAMSIRDEDQVAALMDATWDRFGKVDCLVNNAGGQFVQDAIDYTKKGWRSVIDLNLNGTWYMMQEAAIRWRDTGYENGNIINNVATVNRGMPQSGHTCAARAGIIALSKTVSTEWAAHRIRVNCVAPGSIETTGFNVYSDEALVTFNKCNPMKRTGNAWDVAEAMVYLAGPSGNFITGEVLTVDGGMSQMGWMWPAGKPDYFKDIVS